MQNVKLFIHKMFTIMLIGLINLEHFNSGILMIIMMMMAMMMMMMMVAAAVMIVMMIAGDF